MSKVSSSSLYLSQERPDSHTVAWRNGAPVRYGELLARVDAWRSFLLESPKHQFALSINDTIEFAAALLGGLQAGKRLYLPSNTLPATNNALSKIVDGFLGEYPLSLEPQSPVDDKETPTSTLNKALSVPSSAEVVVFTSGSTGNAQAIPKRFNQLLSEVANLERHFGHLCTTCDVTSTVSHQHIYGLLFKVLWPLFAGRPIQIQNFNFPEELIAATAERSAILVSSPAHLKRFPDSTAWSGALHRIKLAFSSGGPLDEKAAFESAKIFGETPIEIYGSSETGGIAWRQRSKDHDDSWFPFSGVSWRINGSSNELEIRSPYLPNEEWLRMSDQVKAAKKNRFFLLGRSDRIVKIEEKRISLEGIEKALMSSPLVSDARVALVETGNRGKNKLAAFIVPSPKGWNELAHVKKLGVNRQLKDVLASSFERVALPKVWRYLDQMPTNAQGKTAIAELLNLLDTAQPENQVAQPKFPQERLLEQNEKLVQLELSIPSNLYYFDGHFPNAPILPGVVQVDWAIHYGKRYFEIPAEFSGMQTLKFQNVILPGTRITLELQHDSSKSRVAFRYFSESGQHASGQILFKDTA